jgi:hypothetical protein
MLSETRHWLLRSAQHGPIELGCDRLTKGFRDDLSSRQLGLWRQLAFRQNTSLCNMDRRLATFRIPIRGRLPLPHRDPDREPHRERYRKQRDKNKPLLGHC